MPSHSFLLGVGTVLSTLSSTAFAAPYQLKETYTADNWLQAFEFKQYDKNFGFVNYVDEATARQKGMYYKNTAGDIMFGVDSSEQLNYQTDVGRKSVRLEGRKNYNQGLFIIDIKTMPAMCGMWPAFWSLGQEPWPVKGEIDIIEGVNDQATNKYILHTDTSCKVSGQAGQSGQQGLTDCALDGPYKANGCDVSDTRTTSYGKGFNDGSGGVYAMEWTDDAIRTWFFPRTTTLPASLRAGAPNPEDFGTPAANFKGACNVTERFKDQRFIFTNNFCGEWAGNVYSQSNCPKYNDAQGRPLSSMDMCKRFVAENPASFAKAFWTIASFKTYGKGGVVVSSSSSSVARSSSSSSSAARSSSSSSSAARSSTSSSSVARTSPSSSITRTSRSSSSAARTSKPTSSSARTSRRSSSSARTSKRSSSSARTSKPTSSAARPTSSSSSSRSSSRSSSSSLRSTSNTPSTRTTASPTLARAIVQKGNANVLVISLPPVIIPTLVHPTLALPTVELPSSVPPLSDKVSEILSSASAVVAPIVSIVAPSDILPIISEVPTLVLPSSIPTLSDKVSEILSSASAVVAPIVSNLPGEILPIISVLPTLVLPTVELPSSIPPLSNKVSEIFSSASAVVAPIISDIPSVLPSVVLPSSVPQLGNKVSEILSSASAVLSEVLPVVSDLPTLVLPTVQLPSSVPQLSSKVSEILSSASAILPSNILGGTMPISTSHGHDANYGSGYPTSSISMALHPTDASSHGGHPAASSAASYVTGEYDEYNPVHGGSPAKETPVYANGYDAHHNPVYVDGHGATPSHPVKDNDYPGLPALTMLSSHHEAATTKASYSNGPAYDAHPEGSKPTSTTTVTYVDVCETGYTTITTTHIVTYLPSPSPPVATKPTPGSEHPIPQPPPGFQVTTKLCNKGCGTTGPTVVTVTIPIPIPHYAQPPPSQPTQQYTANPSTPIPTVITLSTIPIPATNNSPAQHPSPPRYSAGEQHPAPPDAYKPGNPVQPDVKPSAGYAYPASNGTVRYSTDAASPAVSQTGYLAPQFTGAASSIKATGKGIVVAMLGVAAPLWLFLL